MGFYVESADRPYHSRIAAEDIHVGTLVNENGSDQFELTDGADESTFEYLATAPRRGDYVAKEPDETTTFEYLSSENDRVPALPLADRDVVKIRTATDTGGNESAPTITDGDVVGLIDTSAGTLSSTADYAGRIVEEGYTDGESTAVTYNRSNNNFIPVGVAYRSETADFSDGWDVPIRVEIRRDL